MGFMVFQTTETSKKITLQLIITKIILIRYKTTIKLPKSLQILTAIVIPTLLTTATLTPTTMIGETTTPKLTLMYIQITGA